MLKKFKESREKIEQNLQNSLERNAAQRRMSIDIQQCRQAQMQGIYLSFPNELDLSHVIITIQPNQHSFYHGAMIEFSYTAPPSYPHVPPTVQCIPSVLHPNFDAKGNVCLSLLKEGWRSTYDLRYVCIGLLNLLNNLNQGDIEKPLDLMAAELFHANVQEYAKTVQRTLRGHSYKDRNFTKLIK